MQHYLFCFCYPITIKLLNGYLYGYRKTNLLFQKIERIQCQQTGHIVRNLSKLFKGRRTEKEKSYGWDHFLLMRCVRYLPKSRIICTQNSHYYAWNPIIYKGFRFWVLFIIYTQNDFRINTGFEVIFCLFEYYYTTLGFTYDYFSLSFHCWLRHCLAEKFFKFFSCSCFILHNYHHFHGYRI